jgi:cytochrome c
MHRALRPPILGCLLAAATVTVAVAGDPVMGEKYFARCRACHSSDPDNRSALYGIFGRKAGGWRTAALKDSGIVWDEAGVRKFIRDPKAMVPGTLCGARVQRDDDVDNVIAYLKAMKPR